jgi:hypothetical protein
MRANSTRSSAARPLAVCQIDHTPTDIALTQEMASRFGLAAVPRWTYAE